MGKRANSMEKEIDNIGTPDNGKGLLQYGRPLFVIVFLHMPMQICTTVGTFKMTHPTYQRIKIKPTGRLKE